MVASPSLPFSSIEGIDGGISSSHSGNDSSSPNNWHALDALVLEYQAGKCTMEDLVPALTPLVRFAVQKTRRGLYARRDRLGDIQALADFEDIEQQAWLGLPYFLDTHRPDRGAQFSSYVLSYLPKRVSKDIVHQSLTLRSGGAIRFVSSTIEHEDGEVTDLLATISDEDGRTWDDQLIAAEMLADIPDTERRALALHVVERAPFRRVAHALGVAPRTARRLVARALRQARATDGVAVPAVHHSPAVSAEDLLAVLNRIARWDGTLPGRSVVCDVAGLTQRDYALLMAELVQAGHIIGRSHRHPGWLASTDRRQAAPPPPPEPPRPRRSPGWLYATDEDKALSA